MTTTVRRSALAAWLALVTLAAPVFADKPPGPWTGRNIRVVGYSETNRRPGFKLAIQEVGGRWLLYMGHLWDRGWSIMDVTNPRDPQVVKFIPGPTNTWTIQMDVAEGKMITALERIAPGWGGDLTKPFDEGVLIWSLADPVSPKLLGQFKTGGTGTHRDGYFGGKYVHLAAGMPGYSGNIYVIIDICDPAHIKKVGQLPFSPPFLGNSGAHSALPLPKRNLAIVNSESIREDCNEPLNHASLVDVSNPATPTLIALLPLPVPPSGLPYKDFCHKGGRFGPHNVNHHHHSPFTDHSDTLVYLTYFNAGLRIYDISNATLPKEVAWFIPPDPVHRYGPQPVGSLVEQTEDVLVDTRGYIYVTNKNQGLWILKLDREGDDGERD